MLKRFFLPLLITTSCLMQAGCGGGELRPEPPVDVSTTPVDARRAVITLLDKYQVVGLSELHHNQEIWDLVDDVLLTAHHNQMTFDLSFEGGNSALQEDVDSYVNGGAVTEAQVKRIWRDNTQVSTTFDAPVYLRMLKRVREINSLRPQGRRMRVLLLDPPIDWKAVKGPTDYMPFLLQREPNMVSVVQKETFGKGRKLLFIAGSTHIERGSGSQPFRSALAQLEEAKPGSTIAIGLHTGFGAAQDKIGPVEQLFEKWPKSSLALLRDTEIGRLPAGINSLVRGPDGKPIDFYPGLKLQDLFEAILFLGRRDELRTSSPSAGVCTQKPEDVRWQRDLLQRQVLIDMPPPLRATAESICKPLPVRYFDMYKV